MNLRRKAHLSSRVWVSFWLLLGVWTGCIVGSYLWNLRQQADRSLQMARRTAQIIFENDVLYRRWSANHGGVYVRVSEDCPPNPYLKVPDRDVTTTTGVALTLVNPAYMTRQVNSLVGATGGSRGRLTSLKPIRPENAPDPWEAAALRSFEEGVPEVVSVEETADGEQLRLMRPFIVEQGCVRCHAAQGYNVGDIRGGVSVSVPMASLRAIEKPMTARLGLAHLGLWVVGLLGIEFFRRGLGKEILGRQRVEDELREAHAQLEARVQRRTAELNQAMQTVEAEQQRFQEVLDQLPAYVVLLSPDYHVPFANAFFEDRFGKAEGRRCHEYLFQRTEPCGNCETYEVLKTGAPHRWEWTGPDGRNYDIHDFPFTDVDGSPLIMEVGLDVTERKRADAALKEASENLEQRVAERTAALEESEQRVRRKLQSVLSPEGDLDALELADLIDVPALQDLMDDFHAVAHIPVGILDVKGRVLVSVGWQDICTQFHRVHPDTCRRCLVSDTELSAGLARGDCRLYKCKNNLWDMATPIIVGDHHVGNIFTGQFFFEDETPDREFFRAQARQYGFNEESYLAALDRAPRLNRQTVDRAIAFFRKLADMLSQLGYSNVKLARLLTERDGLTRSLQESERRLRTIGDQIPGGAIYQQVQRPDGRVMYAYMSAGVESLFGVSAERVMSDPESFRQLILEEDRPRVVADEERSARELKPFVCEFRQRMATGEIKWVQCRSMPRRLEDGSLLWDGVVMDITGIQKAQESLNASLAEKEVLLKEIHHRVKNNMQVISSLVALQADRSPDDRMRTVLQDVTHRVRSMALVHEKLYESSDMARVEFAEYVQSLLGYLWHAHATASGVRLVTDLEPVSLSVNAAVPCGLILNELVSNALKHAFRGRAAGEVAVSLRDSPDGRVCLRVRDNGTGLPPDFDWRQADSLGLRLVQILAGQLRATVEVSGGEGTEFSVTWEMRSHEQDQDIDR
ncbi:MAG: PocR ligand-binding domain-containing protein [Thermoguttaceae bacterium]|jgi:PAS domain S-box-containing protein|nr:PocR ligand-binding domain-containing protein [Thermoguttaceae bacterium]